MARHRRKPLISAKVEMRGFCLLRRCPNPRRTQNSVLETLEDSIGYAILQIADGRSTPVLFRFSLLGERIVPKNPIHICFGSLERTHLIFRLLILGVHGFFLRQELGVFCLQALDGWQLFQPLFIKELLNGLVQNDFRFMLRKELFGIASLAIGKRIAGILDKFYMICTDLSEGLPVEIEVRQKI